MACSGKCVISVCHCSPSIASTPARQMRQMSHSVLKRAAEKGDRSLSQWSSLQSSGTAWTTTHGCRFNAIERSTIGNSRIDKKEQNDDDQRAYEYLPNDRTSRGGDIPGGVRGRHWGVRTLPIHSWRAQLPFHGFCEQHAAGNWRDPLVDGRGRRRRARGAAVPDSEATQ